MRPRLSTEAVFSEPILHLAESIRAAAVRHWKILLVGLQVLKVGVWFRGIEWSSGLPVMNVDFVQYYARVLRIHEFLQTKGRIWGYDPFEMAGYVSGPFHEVGIHLVAILCHILSPVVSIERSLLLIEIAGFLLAPFLLIVAVRNFGGSSNQGWVAFGLSVFLFGGLESFSMQLISVGLWGYMMASYLAVWQVSAVWRWTRSPTAGAWVQMAVSSALVFQCHPSAVTITLVPNLWSYISSVRRLSLKNHAWLAGALGLVLATNWYWISPFVRFSEWRSVASYFVTAGFKSVLSDFGPIQYKFFLAVCATANIVIACVFIGTLKNLDRDRALLFSVWAGQLFILAYFGSSFPFTDTLQPGRTKFPFRLVLWTVIAFQLSRFLWSGPRRRAATVALASLAVLLSTQGLLAQWYYKLPILSTRLLPQQTQVVEYLKNEKNVGGRILLESSDSLTPNFADLLPRWTGHAFLGGPHPGNFLAARNTIFVAEHMQNQEWISDRPMVFGRNLVGLEPSLFEKYLRLYNVRRVIARSAPALKVLESYGSVLTKIHQLGDYDVFLVQDPGSWLLEGQGDVKFTYDRIEIENPSRGPLVLSFHWIKTLRAYPPLPLEPVLRMDDPVPFIRIDNSSGADRIVIVNP